MIPSTTLLSNVPEGLRKPLLEEYASLIQGFRESRWKAASLDAGRFCEIAYTVILGALNGRFPAAPSKPSRFVDACKALEAKSPVAIGDHSLRVLLPRVLPSIYDIRNNRNVGHVGGDVVSNKMDASFVVNSCTFVLAEFVRIFHSVDIAEAQASVDMLVERQLPLIWEFDGGKRVLNVALKAFEKILVLLYSEATWVSVDSLVLWIKYSNATQLRTKVLGALDADLLIEFDRKNDRAQLTPLGIKKVEQDLI